jgi:hypothetical protein
MTTAQQVADDLRILARYLEYVADQYSDDPEEAAENFRCLRVARARMARVFSALEGRPEARPNLEQILTEARELLD